MDWLLDPFSLALQQRALIGGSLAAVALALVGTWVVIRGMTFLGDALYAEEGPDPDTVEQRLQRFYDPYYAAIRERLDDLRARHDTA